jgi:ribonuclease Z
MLAKETRSKQEPSASGQQAEHDARMEMDALELYFLGTGAGLPSKDRNVTSIALRMEQETAAFWLFDCGEGTQHRMLASPLRPAKLERIFITHLHGDHVFGLPGLLGSRGFQSGTGPVTIVGPAGIRSFVEMSLAVSETHLPYAVETVEVDEGSVVECPPFTIRCRRLDHGIPSFGYRLEEKPRRGALRDHVLREWGIPEGPLYGQLKAGRDVVLDDGRIIRAADVVGPAQPGRILTILGDTRPCAASVDLATDSTLLVHEATYMARDASRALRYHHSTTVDAATVAKSANAKQLALTHVSSRYRAEDMETYLAEATAIFPNTQVAHDYWSIHLSV